MTVTTTEAVLFAVLFVQAWCVAVMATELSRYRRYYRDLIRSYNECTQGTMRLARGICTDDQRQTVPSVYSHTVYRP